MKNMERFGQEVIPKLRDIWTDEPGALDAGRKRRARGRQGEGDQGCRRLLSHG
jgi:hypothetical protein